MTKNITFKKTLSVFLSVLMIMSCWVWVAPTEAEAATSVGVTTSFTLSPNGNRGNDGNWTRLALTGEGAAAGTSIIVFNFSNANVKAMAEYSEIKLKFYAYSCNNRLKSETPKADVYYVTRNQAYVDGKSGTSQNVGDTGNAILGTTFTGTAAQEQAKSYFGLSDSTKIETFTQPEINGQDYSSYRSGTANCVYDVTNIIKEKAETSENLSFVVMLQKAYECSGTNGWSDIYINSDTIKLSEYNAVEEAASLKTAIDTFEAKFSDGRFYTNIVNAYEVYNNAKRYYDAVVYGGVTYDASIAQNYITQLNNAFGSYNSTYIDYLNTTITSQNGSKVSENYRQNVIYYPWDFSWDITTNTAKWTVQDTTFHWSMPNIIVGVTSDKETTFPLHQFFFTGTSSRYVRYIIAGSEKSGAVVGSNDFKTMAPWRVSTTRHTTSGFAPGDSSAGFGNWAFESGYSGTIDNYEDNSNNFSYSTNYVYQVSTYAQLNKSTLGVNDSNLCKEINTGFTWGTSNSANNGTTAYENHYASESGINGKIYAVYMEPYRINYNNWSSIIPNFNNKSYNGYSYNSASTIAGYLDNASNIAVDHGLNESNRTGNISATVSEWATRINDGANYLAIAKTNADNATRITTKYNDLIAALSAAESICKNDQNKYTVASWATFKAAYEAARDHMASLDPNGNNTQYSTDATLVGDLATALNNAKSALEYITIKFVAYDGTVLKTVSAENGEVYIGTYAAALSSMAPENTTAEKDAAKHHFYSWPTFSDVKDSAEYKEVKTSSAHTWGDWKTVSESTCAVPGSMERTCTVAECDYVETQSTALKSHEAGEPAVENSVAPKCETPGSYDMVTRCKNCNKVLSEKTFYINAPGHTEDEGVITKAPTCTEVGNKIFTCTTCGATRQEVVGKIAHTEVIDAAVATTCTTTGLTEGKHCSVCGTVTVEQTETPALGHDYDSNGDGQETEADGVVNPDSTCTTEGIRTYTCKTCGDTKTEAVSAKGHTPATAVIENEKPATCITDGSYDEVVYCSVCDAEVTRTPKSISATGVHVYGEWSYYNATEHAGKCTADIACTATTAEAHIISNEVLAFDTTYHYYKCEKCTAYGALLNGVFTEKLKEECYGEGTTYAKIEGNLNQHNVICKCGNTKTANHGWTEDTSKRDDATCTTDGTAYYNCSACGMEKTETLPAGHTYGEWIDEEPATCIEEGTKGHYNCSACDKYFDADKNEIDDLTIDTNDNHVNTTEHEKTDETCIEVGYTAGTFCEDCDTWISGHEEIPAIAHKNKVRHEKIDATCVATGTIEYWSCPDCSKNFSDEACTTEVTDLVVDIEPANHTKLNKTDAVEESCTTDGNIDYWTCEGCGKIYRDANATVEITAAETVISKTDHKWGDWEFVADGEHKRVCANDASHIEKEACADSATDTDCLCDKCGNLVAHSYGNATCDAPATCTVCGATTGGTLGHDYTVYVETVDYTCTTDGYTVYKCSRCDSTENRNITNAAHRPEAAATVMQKATCEADGYKAILCSECDAEISRETIEKRAHVYTDNGEAQKATCLADGVMNTICTNVETDTHEACTHESTRVIAQLDHSYTGEYVWYNTAESKSHAQKCVNGCEEPNPVTTPCDFDEDVTEPTCSTNGYTTYTCKICHNHYDADYTTRNHIYVYAPGNGTSHVVTCQYDDCNYTATENCSGGTATCTAKAICENCKTAYGSENADNHTGEATVTKNYKKETCSAEGYSGDIHWSCCDALHTKGTVVNKLAHTEETVTGKAATCTEDGLTDGKKCSVCGEVTVEQTVITANGHNFINEVLYKAPSCTDPGNEAYKQCSVCNKYFSGDAASNSTDGKADTTTFVIGALNHDFATAFTVDKKATCTENGSKSRHCSRCSATTEVTEITARMHNLADVDEAKAATCTEDGLMNQKCTNAATDEYEACTYTTTRVISAKGHSYGSLIAKVPATCKSEGSIAHYTCSVCAKNFDESKNEVSSLVIGIDASAHTKLVKTEAKAETCEEAGNIDYWTCEGCNKIYGDEEATTQISIDDTVIATKNHNMQKTADKIEPTCEVPGKEAVYTCANGCGKTTGGEEIAALGHSYSSVVTAPTCTEKGYTTHTCAACNDSYKDSYIDATGHKWDDGVLTRPYMTVTRNTSDGIWNDGYYTYTCTVCGETKTEEVKRADYSAYDIVVEELNKLLDSDSLSDDDKDNIRNALSAEGNGIADNLIYSEQSIVDTAVSELQEVLGKYDTSCKHLSCESVVVDPTCHSIGYTIYTCKDCGYAYRVDGAPADYNLHVWGRWYESTSSSCREVRTRTRSCLNEGCYVSETETLKDADRKDVYGPHILFVMSGQAASCTVPGYTDYTRCTVCGLITESEVIPATGHVDNDNNGNCDVCHTLTKPGESKCGCLCHNDSFFGELLFRFVNFFWKLFGMNQTCDCGVKHY